MKYIKKAVFTLPVLMLLCVDVRAQQQIPPATERAAKLTDWMKTNLQLSEEQLPKVQGINLKYAQKMDELRNSPADRRQKFTTLKQEDAAKDAELKDVLTDSQYQTYLAKKNEMKKKFKEKVKQKRSGAA